VGDSLDICDPSILLRRAFPGGLGQS